MADSILASQKPSSSSLLNPPRIICHVCQKQFSQYTCPRCNSRLIVVVVLNHSREKMWLKRCSRCNPDDETKQKMLDILKRFHSEEEMDSMDEDDSTLSEETIQNILSDEKKRFLRAVASGELSKMIEPWDPWWLKPSAGTISLSKLGTQLIQPLAKHDESVSPNDDLKSDQSSEIPAGPEDPLPSVRKLSSTDSSPLLVVHLIDIIYSYCFTLRLYNGDRQSDALGSAMMFLSVSSVLGQGGQPESVQEALLYCLEQTCTTYRHMGGLLFGLTVIDDVISLLSLGGSALVCALRDLKRLIQAAYGELKSEKTR